MTPKHPYTRALLNAVPSINPHKKNIQKTLEGEIPSIYDRPNGCVFQSRCSKVIDQCRQTEPLLNKIDNHAVACINLDD